MSNTNLSRTLKPRSWRSQEMHDRYETERQADLDSDACPLCDAPSITEFEHWRIIPNKYPYDAVALKHDQIIPKHHWVSAEIPAEAWAELTELKERELNQEYSFIIEALPGTKSIPGHFHLHLMVPKQV
jgi:hypothetical protein